MECSGVLCVWCLQLQQILHPPFHNDAKIRSYNPTIPKSQETFGKWVNESTFSNHGFFNFSTSNHFKPVETGTLAVSNVISASPGWSSRGWFWYGRPSNQKKRRFDLPTKIKSCNLKIKKQHTTLLYLKLHQCQKLVPYLCLRNACAKISAAFHPTVLLLPVDL